MNHATPFQLLISFNAVWQLLYGLKPCEASVNVGSSLHSRTIFMACWIILSLGELMPRGLFFPLGLGM